MTKYDNCQLLLLTLLCSSNQYSTNRSISFCTLVVTMLSEYLFYRMKYDDPSRISLAGICLKCGPVMLLTLVMITLLMLYFHVYCVLSWWYLFTYDGTGTIYMYSVCICTTPFWDISLKVIALQYTHIYNYVNLQVLIFEFYKLICIWC